MGFLLRAHGNAVELHVSGAGALTTVHRGAGGAVRVIHGDLLEPGFELAPADAAMSTMVGDAFLLHCGAGVNDGEVVLWTDHGGQCPLLYTRDRSGALVAATSAAALLPLQGQAVQLQDEPRRPGGTGFAGIAAVPAGAAVTLPVAGDAPLRTLRHFRLPRPEPMPPEQAVQRVGARLADEVARLLKHRDTAAVLLSGGVDSSTVAALARPRLARLRSYTVGTCYGDEFGAARRVAELLGTDHTELLLTPAALERLLPRMIRLLETWELDTLRIAAPICFALDQLRGREQVLLTGYGADLLFAGLGGAGEPAAIEQQLRAGVAATGCSNEFSPALADDNRILIRHPYWTAHMIMTALAVPVRWKLHDGAVKWVLRQAAARVLPAEVTQRPKLAIQEGTAMHRLFAEVLGDGNSQAQAAGLRRIAADVFTAAQPQEGDIHAHLAGVAA